MEVDLKARVFTILCFLSLFQVFAQEIFSSAELRQDFDFIVETIQEVHPRPFTNIGERDLKQLQVQVENQLEGPLTKEAFYELIKPYVESFEDDHTMVYLEPTLIENGVEALVERARQPRSYIQINDVGVLELPSFWITPDEQDAKAELEEFTNFFERSFERFHNKGVTTLVIDLRENHGGNSAVGDMLVTYLTDKPYRMFASSEIKISSQLIDWRERLGYEVPENFYERAGETFSESYPLESPPATPLRFEGEVFVLTSQMTASSATDFAAVIKDFELGSIVGEETGGLPTHVGNSIIFTLPETGLELRVSSTYFVRPGNFDDGRGVLPDCEVAASEAIRIILAGECQPIATD